MSLADAKSALSKDPVCGMTVDPATAKHKAEHAGAAYYFCSAGCREKFVAEPERYLDTEGALADRGHREGLQRENPAPSSTVYTCPMHPQIRQDHPGNCPICGMALEPERGGEIRA